MLVLLSLVLVSTATTTITMSSTATDSVASTTTLETHLLIASLTETTTAKPNFECLST